MRKKKKRGKNKKKNGKSSMKREGDTKKIVNLMIEDNNIDKVVVIEDKRRVVTMMIDKNQLKRTILSMLKNQVSMDLGRVNPLLLVLKRRLQWKPKMNIELLLILLKLAANQRMETILIFKEML